MTQEQLLETLVKLIGSKQEHCHGGCQCNCPEKNLLEQSAVRFNEAASSSAAQMQQAAVSQQAAQFAALLAQQERFVTR